MRIGLPARRYVERCWTRAAPPRPRCCNVSPAVSGRGGGVECPLRWPDPNLSPAPIMHSRQLPSNCPQYASRHGKKPWRNRTSARRAKSLSFLRLGDKLRFRQRLRKRPRSNPPPLRFIPPTTVPLRRLVRLRVRAALARPSPKRTTVAAAAFAQPEELLNCRARRAAITASAARSQTPARRRRSRSRRCSGRLHTPSSPTAPFRAGVRRTDRRRPT